MNNNAIEFSGVWKKFARGEKFDSLRDLIPSMARAAFSPRKQNELQNNEFWALKDVSFALGPGDALGIIGPNGSGKSTTLKLLSKILRPDVGKVTVRGRLGTLIELGVDLGGMRTLATLQSGIAHALAGRRPARGGRTSPAGH